MAVGIPRAPEPGVPSRTFDDGTHSGFGGPLFSCASGVDQGGVEDAMRDAGRLGAEIAALYPAPVEAGPPGTEAVRLDSAVQGS